jgi:hypothetical protein
MQEENNSQTEVTITTPENNSTTETSMEPLTEAIDEVAEVQADSEVEIAEIRAAETIGVAQINADVERERIAAQERATTNVVESEEEKWQEITSLREQVTSLSETVTRLAQSLTTPEPDPSTLPQSEVVEVENLTPQSTSEETSETQMEALQENVGEKPGAEAAALVRRVRRAI